MIHGWCSLLLLFRFLCLFLLVPEHVAQLHFVKSRLDGVATALIVTFIYDLFASLFTRLLIWLLLHLSLLHSLLSDLDEVFKVEYLFLVLIDVDDGWEVVGVRGALATNSQHLFVRAFNIQVVVMILEELACYCWSSVCTRFMFIDCLFIFIFDIFCIIRDWRVLVLFSIPSWFPFPSLHFCFDRCLSLLRHRLMSECCSHIIGVEITFARIRYETWIGLTDSNRAVWIDHGLQCRLSLRTFSNPHIFTIFYFLLLLLLALLFPSEDIGRHKLNEFLVENLEHFSSQDIELCLLLWQVIFENKD